MRNRIGKKLFGLGVTGAAFLGGAGFGFGVGLLSYSILHRYFFIRNALFEKGLRTEDWDEDYYKQFYLSNQCQYGCPENSHCEWSYCECDVGYTRFRGKCYWSLSAAMMENSETKDRTGESCKITEDCSKHDLNLICGPNKKCRCKEQMKYNPRAQECQILLDINCGQFTYDTGISTLVKEAADKAKKAAEEKKYGDDKIGKEIKKAVDEIPSLSLSMQNVALMELMMSGSTEIGSVSSSISQLTNSTDGNRTETISESLSKSMLKYLSLEDAKAKDLEEAFCRDIDSFNSAYITDDGSRPANCPEVPINYCVMLFDSKDCTGGWSLNATDGTEMNFYYFSSNWKYRNDLDTIGLRFGCTFTGFSSTGFSGNKMILTADTTDRWVVLKADEGYNHFHEDIEYSPMFPM